MSFLENVEKTVFVMMILGILTAIAMATVGATAGVAIAILLNLPIIKAVKTATLMGMLTGGSLGLLLPLAYMFRNVNKKK